MSTNCDEHGDQARDPFAAMRYSWEGVAVADVAAASAAGAKDAIAATRLSI